MAERKGNSASHVNTYNIRLLNGSVERDLYPSLYQRDSLGGAMAASIKPCNPRS